MEGILYCRPLFEEFWDRGHIKANFSFGHNQISNFLIGAGRDGAFDDDDCSIFEIGSGTLGNCHDEFEIGLTIRHRRGTDHDHDNIGRLNGLFVAGCKSEMSGFLGFNKQIF